MKNINTIHRQSGAVSLFVVIFAMLLMSVVTIGFLRIMTNDQSKATGSDLAQSAYDSSQAGVEDAKRALIWYSQNCLGASPHSSCASFLDSLETCNGSIAAAGVVAGEINVDSATGRIDEVKVQQSTSVDIMDNSTDQALDQAYTCVTLDLDTVDFVGSLNVNQSVIVPLVASGPITNVVVEWFNREDVTGATGNVSLPTIGPSQRLIRDWPPNRPPVLRTQFMQVGNDFRLTDFDTTTASAESNANTLFLYPMRNGNTSAVMTERDSRKNAAGESLADEASDTALPSNCQPTVSSGNYACRISLTLPTPVNGGNRATAYLRLTSMYAGGHFRITLDGPEFRNVQPIVDSTGRANDVFRRVQSRVDLYDTAFPYPDAALDTRGSLCKDFGVTNDRHFAGADCTP